MNFIILLYKAGLLWFDRGAGNYSAAFSYYAPLALIPLLLFSLSVVSFFYGQTFSEQVFAQWGSVLGSVLVELIRSALVKLNVETQTSKLPFMAGFFFLGLYLVAVNVLSEGFHKLWGNEVTGLWSFLKRSFRAVWFLFVLQLYLLIIIGLDFFIAPTLFGPYTMLISAVFFATTTVFFILLYRVLVLEAPSWTGCFAGATVASLLFVVIKNLVDFYIATTPVLTLYGAANLILILLVWIYILAALIFYGAAVAGLYDKMYLTVTRK